MWDFENLGMISSSETEVLYKSRATFGFEVTAHTNVDFRSVYPNINLNKQHTEWFFSIQREYFLSWATSVHDVSWNTIELGDMREHDYDGSIPITIGIRDIIGNTGSITLNGQTFDTPAYTSDVIKTTVTNIRDGEVGGYVDRFTNVADVSEGEVSLQILEDDFSAAETAVVNWYNDKNLGWRAGDIERGGTIQQSMIGGSQIGTEFTNIQSSSSYTFSLNAQIKPEVYEFVQYNTITSAKIKYYAWGLWEGNIDPKFGPSTGIAKKRIVAVHTTNGFLHWEFEVDVEFYATIQSTAELTQAILNDPYLKAGDIMWDSTITGDYKVDVPLTTQDDILDWLDDLFGGLFGNIQNILMLVAIIAVSIVVLYIALKFRKGKRGGKRTIIKIMK